MIKHIDFVVAGLAALTLNACAAEVYHTPARTTVAVQTHSQRWQDPAYFTARVQARVALVEQRVRADVQTGQARPEAIAELDSRRGQIDAELAQIAADGVVTVTERDYVRALVRDISGLPVRYALNVGAGYFGNPYGGGPPSSYVPQQGLGDDAWW